MAEGPEIRVNVTGKADTSGLKDLNKQVDLLNLNKKKTVDLLKAFASQMRGIISLGPAIGVLKNPITAIAVAVGIAVQRYAAWKAEIKAVAEEQRKLNDAVKSPTHYWTAVFQGVQTLKEFKRQQQDILKASAEERKSVERILEIDKEREDWETRIAQARRNAASAAASELESDSERIRIKGEADKSGMIEEHQRKVAGLTSELLSRRSESTRLGEAGATAESDIQSAMGELVRAKTAEGQFAAGDPEGRRKKLEEQRYGLKGYLDKETARLSEFVKAGVYDASVLSETEGPLKEDFARLRTLENQIQASINQQIAHKQAVLTAEQNLTKANQRASEITKQIEANKDKQESVRRSLGLEKENFPVLLGIKTESLQRQHTAAREREIERGGEEWMSERSRVGGMSDDYAERMTQWRLKGGVRPEMPGDVAEEAAFWDTSKPSGASRFQQKPMQFATSGQQIASKEQSMQKYLAALARLTEEDIDMFGIMTAQIESLQKDIENLKSRVNTNRGR